MIFKTITSSVDETRQTLALFNKDWNTYKTNWQNANGFFGKIGSVFTPANAITKSDLDAIKAYNAQIDACATSQTAFNRTMLNASPAAQNLVASYNGGKVSAQGMATAQNMAKTSTIGLTIAQTALNAAIGMGVGLLINLVVQGVNKLIHANEEAIESAKKLREEYEQFKSTNASNVSTLKGLEEEFNELSKGVSQYGDNLSLTTEQYERYKEIIQQIVGMSPDLAEGYSTENGYIADKNGLLERAIELQEIEYRNELRKITNLENLKTSMSGYIAEYKDALNGGIITAEGNIVATTIDTDFKNSLWQLYNTNNREDFDGQDMAKDIMKSLGIEDVDKEMQKYFNEHGYWQDSLFWNDYCDTIINNLNAVTDSLSFEEVGLDETTFDQNLEKLESYAESYADMKDSVEMANEAIQTDLGYIAEYADGYADLSTEQQKFVADFLKGYDISDISSENSMGILEYDNDKMASVKREIKNFVEELSQDETTKEALADLYAIPTDEQSIEEFVEQFRNALEVIEKYCAENGIEIPIAITDSKKAIDELEAQQERAVNFAKDKFDGYDPTAFFKENSINTQEEVDKWLEIAQAANSAADAEKRYVQGSTLDNETTILSITDTVDKIDSELKPAFDDLKSAYQDIFSLDDNGNRVFNINKVDIDTLSSIKSAIDSMNEIDGVNIATETFDEFAKVLTNTSSTVEDVQKQFDNLVSEMLNESNIVKFGTSVDVLLQSLEQLGIVNIDDVLADAINAERELSEAGIDLETVTNEEAIVFVKESEALDVTKDYLRSYVVQKQLSNENALSTVDDIENLESLCGELGASIELMNKFAKAKSLAANVDLLSSIKDNINIKDTDALADIKEQFDIASAELDKINSEILLMANEEFTFDFEFNKEDFEYGFDGLKNEVDEFGKSVSKSVSSTAETFDWIETLISRIQRNITNLGKVVSATYRNWSTRNNTLAQEMAEVNKEISVQQNAYNAYMAKANSVNLSEEYKALVRSGGYRIDDIADETVKENIKSYEEWYNKALDASDAIEDLRANLAELAKTKFDNVAKQYDEQISLIEHNVSMLEGFVDQSETAGYMASEVYYKAMASKQEENIAELQEKYSSLLGSFDEAVKNGSIEKYSEDWYEMLGNINDVEKSLQDATTQLIEFNQTLQHLSWDVFDRIQDSINNISEETNFLIDILDGYNLHTDNGVITDEGLSVQGLHAVNYNTYMEQSIAYAEELAKIEEEMAKDPYDMELVDRRTELIGLQQEAISNAIAEKDAIYDLIEDGYSKMLDSLQEVIDKRKEALQAEKDLYDYQNSIEEKTSNISSLQKQLQAYSGDNSEEAKTTIQKLQVSLAEAEKDLQETEYERYINDQEQMLDTLYDQTEQWVNERLDNIDVLIAEAIDATNKNAETISNAINNVSNAYGYKISEEMESIWNSANDVVSVYGDVLYGVGNDILTANNNIANAITGGTTNVISTIDNLNVSMKDMIASLNNMATANANSIAALQNAIIAGQSSTSVSTSTPTTTTSTTILSGGVNSNNSNNNSSSNTTQPTDDRTVYYIRNQETGQNVYSGMKNMCDKWLSDNKDIYKKVSTNGNIITVRPYKYIVVDKRTQKPIGDNLTREQAYGMCQANTNWTFSAYASGTPNAKKGWALVGEGEDGNEIILDKEGNALLTLKPQLYNFEGGEQVINGKETAELLTSSLVPLNTEQMWGNIVKTPNLPNVSNGINGNVTNYNQFSFDLPNVIDANSLITELQHSKRFERIIDDMTAGSMLGKNSLNKYRH